MAKLRNSTSSTFGDPTIRVTPNLRGIRTGQTARKLQVPLFGSLGLGCFTAWLALAMLAPAESFALKYPLDALTQARLLLLSGLAVGALAAVLLARSIRNGVGEAVLGVLALVGMTAPSLSVLVAVPGSLLYLFWGIGGLGAFCCLLLWWRHLAAITTQRQMTMALASAACFGAVLALAGVLFRAGVTVYYLLVLDILSIAIYAGARRRVLKRAAQLEDEAEQWDRFRYLVKETLPSFTALALFGGLLAVVGIGREADPAAAAPIVGLLLAGCATLAGLMLFPKSPSFTLLGFSIPVGAVTTLGVLFGNTPVRSIAMTLFCAYFLCLAFTHITNVARNARHLFRSYTTALSLVALLDTVAVLLGLLWGLWAQGQGGLSATPDVADADPMAAVFVVSVLLCLFASAVSFCLFTAHPQARHMPFATGAASGGLKAALTALTGSALRTDYPDAKEDSSEDEGGDGKTSRPSLADVAAALAADHGLSQRETEVFVYLIRGHNAQSIAQKLTISGNTVKTHIRNIYAKFDAHSQQDLLDLIDRELPDKAKKIEEN